jgi:hypothetical protein
MFEHFLKSNVSSVFKLPTAHDGKFYVYGGSSAAFPSFSFSDIEMTAEWGQY